MGQIVNLELSDGTFRHQEQQTGNNIMVVQPTSKVCSTEVFSVTRSMSSDTNAFTLPAGAIPLTVSIYSGTASNAGTTANVSVGKTGTDTFFVSAQDVKGVSGQIPCAAAANLGAVVSASAVTQVVVKYAETGTASATGGPFIVMMDWYMP